MRALQPAGCKLQGSCAPLHGAPAQLHSARLPATAVPLLQAATSSPGASCPHRKSPATFKLSWLPLSMYTAPPCCRACRSSSRSSSTEPAGQEQGEGGGRARLGALRMSSFSSSQGVPVSRSADVQGHDRATHSQDWSIRSSVSGHGASLPTKHRCSAPSRAHQFRSRRGPAHRPAALPPCRRPPSGCAHRPLPALQPSQGMPAPSEGRRGCRRLRARHSGGRRRGEAGVGQEATGRRGTRAGAKLQARALTACSTRPQAPGSHLQRCGPWPVQTRAAQSAAWAPPCAAAAPAAVAACCWRGAGRTPQAPGRWRHSGARAGPPRTQRRLVGGCGGWRRRVCTAAARRAARG